MALALRIERPTVETAGIWLVLLGSGLAAAIALPAFRDPANLANILRQSSVLGIIAIGQTFVIAAGLIDLSVGMISGLVVVLACLILGGDPALTPAVILLMLLLGAGIGLINGALVNRLKLHPLILTFGMLSILQGVIFTITDRSVGAPSPFLQSLANDDIAGIPFAALLLFALAALAQTVLTCTRFGYHLIAAGGNAESAWRAGIHVGTVRLLAFVISGAFAGLAGLVLAGRLGTGYPLAGNGLELDSIVAVVLGGTALSGGRASIWRTIGGVLALALVSNVLNLLAISAFVQMFIKGLIVVIAILLNQPRRAEA